MSASSTAVLSRIDRPVYAAAPVPSVRPVPAARGRAAAPQSGHYSVGDILKYLDANEDGD